MLGKRGECRGFSFSIRFFQEVDKEPGYLAAAEALIRLFCTWVAPSFIFIGGLFVANAAFNNLGYPLLSPTFNWARAALGTIPFAYAGSYCGASGVMVGQAIGSAIVSGIAILVALRITDQLVKGNAVQVVPVQSGSK